MSPVLISTLLCGFAREDAFHKQRHRIGGKVPHAERYLIAAVSASAGEVSDIASYFVLIRLADRAGHSEV